MTPNEGAIARMRGMGLGLHAIAGLFGCHPTTIRRQGAAVFADEAEQRRQRHQRAAQLRRDGRSWTEIADALGYTTREGARWAAARGMTTLGLTDAILEAREAAASERGAA